ncbi:hypothetical protein H4582DRAFT_1559629 [Lactarius indigo]|nr:hypothetical protein H4582DRAFT_1559629 [Lactarius indigo]
MKYRTLPSLYNRLDESVKDTEDLAECSGLCQHTSECRNGLVQSRRENEKRCYQWCGEQEKRPRTLIGSVLVPDLLRHVIPGAAQASLRDVALRREVSQHQTRFTYSYIQRPVPNALHSSRSFNSSSSHSRTSRRPVVFQLHVANPAQARRDTHRVHATHHSANKSKKKKNPRPQHTGSRSEKKKLKVVRLTFSTLIMCEAQQTI